MAKKHIGRDVQGKYCESTSCWCLKYGRHKGKKVQGMYCENGSCWCHLSAPYHDAVQKSWVDRPVDQKDLKDALDFFTNSSTEEMEDQ